MADLDQMRYELMQNAASERPYPEAMSIPQIIDSLRASAKSSPIAAKVLDQVLAYPEMAYSLTAAPFAQLAGAVTAPVKTAADWLTGRAKQAGYDPAAAAQEWMSRFQYEPRTEYAKQGAEKLESFLTNTLKAPPIISGFNPAALTPRPATGAYVGQQGRAAIEPLAQGIQARVESGRSIIPGIPSDLQVSPAFFAMKPKGGEWKSGLEKVGADPHSKLATHLDTILSTSHRAFNEPEESAWRRDVAHPNSPAPFYSSEDKVLRPLDERPLLGVTNAIYTDPDLGQWYTKLPLNLKHELDATGKSLTQTFFDPSTKKISGQLLEWNNDPKKMLEAWSNEKGVAGPSTYGAIREAFDAWIKGPYGSYLTKTMGTGVATDPLLQLAERGIFAGDPEVAKEALGRDLLSGPRRISADKSQHAAEMYEVAHKAGLSNFKPFPTAKTPFGSQIEKLIDTAVDVSNIQTLREIDELRKTKGMPQKYPGAARETIPKEKPVYDIDTAFINTFGLPQIREHVYRKMVEAGKRAPELVPKMTVERAAHEIFEKNQRFLKDLQKNQTLYEDYRAQRMAQLPEKTDLGNGVSMVRFTAADYNDPKQLIRDLSIDTKDLDFCVAQGGHGTKAYPNRASPLLEPHTGIAPEGNTQTSSHYIDDILSNRDDYYRLADNTTGEALAGIQVQRLDKDSGDNLVIRQIKGPGNGKVKPEYQEQVKNWLNANAARLSPDHVVRDLENIAVFDLVRPYHGAQNLITFLKKFYGGGPRGETAATKSWNAAMKQAADSGTVIQRFQTKDDILAIMSDFLPTKPQEYKLGGTVKKPSIDLDQMRYATMLKNVKGKKNA